MRSILPRDLSSAALEVARTVKGDGLDAAGNASGRSSKLSPRELIAEMCSCHEDRSHTLLSRQYDQKNRQVGRMRGDNTATQLGSEHGAHSACSNDCNLS